MFINSVQCLGSSLSCRIFPKKIFCHFQAYRVKVNQWGVAYGALFNRFCSADF